MAGNVPHQGFRCPNQVLLSLSSQMLQFQARRRTHRLLLLPAHVWTELLFPPGLHIIPGCLQMAFYFSLHACSRHFSCGMPMKVTKLSSSLLQKYTNVVHAAVLSGRIQSHVMQHADHRPAQQGAAHHTVVTYYADTCAALLCKLLWSNDEHHFISLVHSARFALCTNKQL